MSSKEALQTIGELHFCGYDFCEKDWYESGVINDTYDEEIKCIQKDLELLEILLRYYADKYIIDNLPDTNSDVIRIKALLGDK